ncbi:MAG TPA: class I SAM-dependent methyltransferase [Candidatus Hydrogenedentes bacterium]|nr:class I SAM-dependent methyltransferase [Candidatus Hydrogenedentota bacterium]
MPSACRCCGAAAVARCLDLGMSPIANAFLRADQLGDDEFTFPLGFGFCEQCHMAQLVHVVPRERLFHEHYAYYSSTSRIMAAHFGHFAREITARFLGEPGQLVVEVGSNDGILLEAFDRNRVRVLGVEPSSNVAKVAQDKGLDTVVAFFDEAVARAVVNRNGKASVLVGANVVCHIADLDGLFRAADVVLDDAGVFVFEDPSVAAMLAQNAYDQIYDEHVYYFSVTALEGVAARHGFVLFDVQPQPTHGGSNRVFMAKAGNARAAIQERAAAALAAERAMGLNQVGTYRQFARRVEKPKMALTALLGKLKASGKRIVGYGASSKGNVVLNYCGIGAETLDYIADSTPSKQGLYSPGMHLPVVAPSVFAEDCPDYALLLAWNHAGEIMGKESQYRDKGGRFITHIPEVRILEWA